MSLIHSIKKKRKLYDTNLALSKVNTSYSVLLIINTLFLVESLIIYLLYYSILCFNSLANYFIYIFRSLDTISKPLKHSKVKKELILSINSN